MTSEEAGDGLKVITHVMKEEEDVTLSVATKSLFVRLVDRFDSLQGNGSKSYT